MLNFSRLIQNNRPHYNIGLNHLIIKNEQKEIFYKIMAFTSTKFSKRCHVKVEFSKGLSTEQVVSEISKASTPQVIFWYVGPNGLRKDGVDFYRDFLIYPLNQKNKNITFWLVDLTAWAAFKHPQCSIQKKNDCHSRIEQFRENGLNCIASADIFRNMQQIADKNKIAYFRNALRRRFIHESSCNFPLTNITIRDIFLGDCPIMADWYNCDSGKLYSAFQYLEGCLIVEEIFLKQHFKAPTSNIELIFVLPNDELKYYRDNQNSFQNDIYFLLSTRCQTLNITNLNVTIKLLAFEYGGESHHRPYNAPGKILRRNELDYKVITGKDFWADTNAKEKVYAG